MAASGDLLHFVHNVSSISVDFKAPTAASQELRSRSLESCRTSIKSVVLLPTVMNQGDSAKDPKRKFTNSIEPRPLRNRDGSRFNQYMKMKFRKDGLNFRHHTCVLNCIQNQCPALRERLENHRCANYRHRVRGYGSKKFREQGINVSSSGMALSQTTPLFFSDGKSVQTDITLDDFILQNESGTQSMNYLKDLSLKGSETRDILPQKNFYKEHLKAEIWQWLQNVPIFYSLDFTVQYLRDNFVNIFVNRITQLVLHVQQESYEQSVKKEIDDCLNILPMWLPNSQKDQVLFKNSLRDKLYYKIKKINSQFLDTNDVIDDENNDNDKKSTEIEEVDLSRSNSLYAKVVTSWLGKIKFTKPVSRKHTVDAIVKRVSFLLNVPLNTKISKTKLKSQIFDILNNLPINMFRARNRNIHLNRFCEELANRLISTREKLESPEKHVAEKFAGQITGIPIYNNQLKQVVHETVSKALGKTTINKKSEIERQVCNVILNSLETLRSGIENNIGSEIRDLLSRTCNITEERALKFAKRIKLFIKIALQQEKASKNTSYHSIKPQLSGAMTIYRSSESGPITSTPKKPSKKPVPKLNIEEKAYMQHVADLVRAWMETLPKNFDDDKQFKETIINDLAGDIMDEVKREQLSPEVDTEKEKHITYFIYRWLSRFEIFEDLTDATPFIEDFLGKLKQIPELQLTAPQQGTRQAMHNLKHIEKDNGWEEDFVPKGLDILEDQISVWMNEQPSEIYASDSKKERNMKIKDLAIKIRDHLQNKHSEDVITEDIYQWLNNVIKPEEKEHLDLLTQYLKDNIIHVPQDETLEALNKKRKRQRAEYRQNVTSTASPASEDAYSLQEDPEQTMKDFILKYVEHNYNIDDPMTRGAFCQLLKTELRKLSPSTRQEVYENFETNEQFAPEKFANELEYISMISDWLKNIPISPLYNTPGNRARVDFVNDLARNIQEAEEQRKEHLDDMDYDLFLSSVIGISLRTYNIPILPEHKNNLPLMINQLLSKIMAKRTVLNQSHSVTSGDMEQNLSEMIDQYIRINTREITDDEIKREAWTARLLKEVKKILYEGRDPLTLTKAQVYERLSQVPIPGKNSVQRFSLEMKYVKEISDWLKNLPLLPITDVHQAEKERISMISELAEKISEREASKSSDPNDNTADKKLVEYITNWISSLPLNPRKSLVIPIVIQQLMNRIERLNRKDQTISDASQLKVTVIPEADSDEAMKNPETHIVESIENWCNKLPIDGTDQDIIRNMKQEIAKKLYQKIGELNVNPRIYNDNILYQSLLEDEIDTLLENLPQNSVLQNNRDSLKAELLNDILGTKKIIAQNFAGDNYKHKLETTIDAAIPNPVQNRQLMEPGFEIYKKHLANMFILDNFDHSDDDIKTKYEKRIRDEVDKYFESAQIRNALPMTKAQMYNELYSELFKVPMPTENAVVDQVEEVKTRCEIDAWFDDLPLREASSIGEYLERDQILSTLAKRIHDIEKYESNPDIKIHNEISKWLQKLPLLSKQESNTSHYVDKLQNTLKTSAEARKYVAAKPKEAINRTTKKQFKKSHNTSQVPGPSTYGKKNNGTGTAYKRPGDLIVDVVENWCDQIPLIGNEVENKIVKDNLSTKIVRKICELNMDTGILNDDIMYDQLLDEELEKYLSDLPTTDDFEQYKPGKKNELIKMIGVIKPLVKEINKKHDYKTELNNTVNIMLNGHNDTGETSLEFDKLKEEIIDNFVQFNYNEDDDEIRQICKRNLHDAVIKCVTDAKDKEKQLDPLIRRNQLLCELSKIPIPNNSLLKNEVDEIKMKHEVEQFFEDSSLNDDTEKTAQIKRVLAKRLNDIEKSGHNEFNDEKMNSEIARSLLKLNKEITPNAIKEFVGTLKNNEAERKRPPINKSPANERNNNDNTFNSIQRYERPRNHNSLTPQAPLPYSKNMLQTTGYAPTEPLPQKQFLQIPTLIDRSHCLSEQPEFLPSRSPENFRQRVDAQDPSNAPNYQGFQNGYPETQQNHSAPFRHGHINNSVSDGIPFNFGYTSQWQNQDPSQLPPNRYNHEPSSTKPFSPPKLTPQNRDQPGYNDFRLRSYGVPDQYGNLSQSSLKGEPSSAFVTPYEPSIPGDQRSVSEATNYRQVITPRRVQGEANEFVPPSPSVRPDSLFQAPTNIPRRFPSHLSVLSRNPSGSSRGLRPTYIPSGQSSRLYCPTIAGTKLTSRIVEPSEEMVECICDKRCKKRKPGTYCMVPAEEYCEACGGFSPTWCRMPLRGCFYMQCY